MAVDCRTTRSQPPSCCSPGRRPAAPVPSSHADASPTVTHLPRSHLRGVRGHLQFFELEEKSPGGTGHSLRGNLPPGGSALTWATRAPAPGPWGNVRGSLGCHGWEGGERLVKHHGRAPRHTRRASPRAPDSSVNPCGHLRSDEDADSETAGRQSTRQTQSDDTP